MILCQQGELVGGQEDTTVLDSVATPHSLADAIREKLLADDDSDQAILGMCTAFLLLCSGCSTMLKCKSLNVDVIYKSYVMIQFVILRLWLK
jgi:hypothetical protein